jgi:hypothetical protein
MNHGPYLMLVEYVQRASPILPSAEVGTRFISEVTWPSQFTNSVSVSSVWSLYLQGPDMSIRKRPCAHTPCLQSPLGTSLRLTLSSPSYPQLVSRISQITITLYDLRRQGTQTFEPINTAEGYGQTRERTTKWPTAARKAWKRGATSRPADQTEMALDIDIDLVLACRRSSFAVPMLENS